MDRRVVFAGVEVHVLLYVLMPMRVTH